MKLSKNLMTGLIGLALMAAPITATAQDTNRGRNDTHPAQVQTRSTESHARAPEHQAQMESRSNESHARAPERQAAPAPRVESRDNGRVYMGAPAVTANREVRGEHNDRDWNNRDRDRDRDYDRGDRDHKDYGDRDFDHDRDYAAGGWVMPNGYGGGACAWARHLRNVYRHDEETGHPAAAADLLYQLHRAERSCGGVPYGFNEYRW